MKLDLQKITKPIDLAEYNEAYSGQVVHVWVSLPREMRDERRELLQAYSLFLKGVLSRNKFLQSLTSGYTSWKLKKLQTLSDTWLAKIWSQHTDSETHWTVQDVSLLNSTDGVLLTWLAEQTVKLIEEYSASKKK